MQTLRRTPLYERHAVLGARFVPFAGWEMPIQFTSIVDEHRAVRGSAGVFDVSHMGELVVRGPDAHEYLQARLTNDLDRIVPGQAQYTLLTNDAGGIVDDLIAYRGGEETYLLVVNAANVAEDLAVLADARDVSDGWGLLAVQGPQALPRLGIEIAPFAAREQELFGVRCHVSGTGYTGERGCEIGCAPDDLGRLWDGIVARGVVPCGLGARDTLRLEAGYPLHGQDITPERTPVEAGLTWACALQKDFPGAEILRRQKIQGPPVRLVHFVMIEPAIPRAGMTIDGAGWVTSGTHSPMLETGIGMGYVPGDVAQPGLIVTIDVRGRPREARIVQKPIYKREES